MSDGHWAIIVHGGARTIAQDRIEDNRRGCAAAAAAGAAILRDGGSAVDAARVAVCVLEDDPTFNAGHGSVANAAGEVEMDAGIMNGESLAVGAVAAVRRLFNPIETAAAMLGEPPVLLVAEGAEAFARSRGLPVSPAPLQPLAASSPGHDTVGCVARDRAGHIAAATSTGGLAGTLPGRVGDAPLPGGGFYADDAVGGVSLSGDGEAIARLLLGARVVRAMENAAAAQAALSIEGPLQRLGAEAGVIAIDASGQMGMAHNSDHFAVAFAAANRELSAITHVDEWTDAYDKT